MSKGQNSGSKGKNSMTGKAAARIQSPGAKLNKGKTPKGSFQARSQSAPAKNGS